MQRAGMDLCACVVCQYHFVFYCHRRPTQHFQRVKTRFSNKVTKKKLVECTQSLNHFKLNEDKQKTQT